jgi:hypothetical protein
MENETRKSIIGLDCGTGNFVAVDGSGTTIQRNAFLSIEKEATTKKQLRRMKVPFVEINDELHIIGQDAFNYANIFTNKELRRPMKDGLLNPTEKDALPVLKHLVGSLIGGESSPGSQVVYCVPGTPIDVEREVDYHEDILKQIIELYGFEARAINEAVALGMAGLEDDQFTGIAISFGSGMANIAIMYMGMSALQFSVSKSGDWIDKQVASDCGVSIAKAQQIKEKGDYSIAPGESVGTREHNAIKTYYAALIRYVLANIAQQFEDSDEMPTFPNAVPIVVGGGTSMPEGFIELFEEQFTNKDFPLDISEIRLVDEPLTAVARGCYSEAVLENEEDEDE